MLTFVSLLLLFHLLIIALPITTSKFCPSLWPNYNHFQKHYHFKKKWPILTSPFSQFYTYNHSLLLSLQIAFKLFEGKYHMHLVHYYDAQEHDMAGLYGITQSYYCALSMVLETQYVSSMIALTVLKKIIKR